MACCVRNIHTKNYQNLVIVFQVTVENVGDVFLRHSVQGGPEKRHKVNDTIILQPYVIESCGFQQNVPKEILYMTKVSI